MKKLEKLEKYVVTPNVGFYGGFIYDGEDVFLCDDHDTDEGYNLIVTQKIEGFFDLCKKRGFTGNQGVLIPVSNIKDLVLKDEVVNAVKDGVFHIYPITHINEGIELLMQCPAGEKDEHGKFPADSVHGKVYAKLKEFASASKNKF